MKRALVFLCLLILLAWPAGASAQAASRATFAIIVTNNHSPNLGRAELQYADDDGAKYWSMFRTITSDDRVALLTDFDRDSARLFPDARAKAISPTRANVDATVQRIGAAARDAARNGEVDLYFVFAGHGDVEQGRGFLELRDGRLDSNDIETILKAIPSTHAHVILDSCNSFFVLNPRKPGGRQIAVTERAAQSLGDRMPNVGVLLSTSAEAEVFEWSELQSGIFSHAVRSGLSGAADANHDGRVTYDELRAFVEIASSRVRNPAYRPKVFARGPAGHGSEAIFDLRTARARVVELEGDKEQRVTLRDRDELPWIDAHKEAGMPMTLRVPLEIAETATVDERDPASGAIVARHALQDKEEQAAPLVLASRGPNEVLGDLFAEPFGPKALAAWEVRARTEAPPVFGVSQEDADRMRLLLGQVADIEHRGRMIGGITQLTFGVGFLAMATAVTASNVLETGPFASTPELGYVMDATLFGLGALLTGTGIATLAARSDGEKLFDDFSTKMRISGIDTAQVVATTEERLRKLARAYRSGRTLQMTVAGVYGAMSAFLLGLGIENGATGSGTTMTMVGAFGLSMGAILMVLAAQPSPVERMWDVWTHDPGLARMPRKSAFTLRPTINGIVGTF